MAIGKAETTVVLGSLGLAIAGSVYALSRGAPGPVEVAQVVAQVPAIRKALPTAAAQPQLSPAEHAPFIATVANEASWRADVLPVAWPEFTKLPDEKPLPAKPTRQKIDSSKALIQRWENYKSGKTKDIPRGADVGIAVKYLLSIDRNDPGFAEAWASFITIRKVDRDLAEEMRAEEMRKAEEALKREAKKRGVTVGMTAEQVIGSNWGKPSSVNTTTTAYGRREQWVYGTSGNYLYFDNGTLTSIQTGH